MFKKLLDGELSLKDTFWKFGVLGMLAVHLSVWSLSICWFAFSAPCWLRNSTA